MVGLVGVVQEVADASTACKEVVIAMVVPARHALVLASAFSRHIAHVKLEL